MVRSAIADWVATATTGSLFGFASFLAVLDTEWIHIDPHLTCLGLWSHTPVADIFFPIVHRIWEYLSAVIQAKTRTSDG